jgi:hypothetical protein
MLQDATSEDASIEPEAGLTMLDQVAAIVIPNCATSGCHDSLTHEHGMNLTSAAKIYEAWVNQKGLDHCRNSARTRVVPGSPAMSYVMAKLTGAETCELSDRMPPPPRAFLTPAEIELIRTWIAAGARSDAPPVDAGDPLDPRETGSDGATIDDATDDTSQDATSPPSDITIDGEGREGGAVTDASPDISDTPATPDAGPCSEAGTAAKVRRAPPPGFALPNNGEQIDCTAAKPCPPTLMCIGGGCDDIWQCFAHVQPSEHPCPTDYEPYCGCDGVTFMSIRTCPDRPYDRVGACEDGVSCDPTQLRCSYPEPNCPVGYVGSVVDGHYGQCVAYSQCQCQFVWECPHRELYKCDTTTKRCAVAPPTPEPGQ